MSITLIQREALNVGWFAFVSILQSLRKDVRKYYFYMSIFPNALIFQAGWRC